MQTVVQSSEDIKCENLKSCREGAAMQCLPLLLGNIRVVEKCANVLNVYIQTYFTK